MKNLILIIAILVTCIACNNKSTVNKPSISKGEKWELITLQAGSFAGSSNKPLPYQEHYVFNSDSTFTKTRLDNDNKTMGSGLYKTSKSEEGIRYSLSYKKADLNIVGSCTGTKTESLLLRPDGKLQNSWMMCDGPFKVYEKN